MRDQFPPGDSCDSLVVMTCLKSMEAYVLLTTWLKFQSAKGLAIQFLWATARLLVTRVSLVYLVLLSMSFSLCSWCSWTKQERWADLRFHLFVSGVKSREWGREVSARFPCVSSGVRELPLSYWGEVRSCNLVRVECLQMIKPIVVIFILLEVDVTLGDGCVIWEHWHSFREVKCLQGCSKILWFSFLVLLKEMRTRCQCKISSCCFSVNREN